MQALDAAACAPDTCTCQVCETSLQLQDSSQTQAQPEIPMLTAAGAACKLVRLRLRRSLRAFVLPGPLVAKRCNSRSSSQASSPISMCAPELEKRSGGTYSPKGRSSVRVESCTCPQVGNHRKSNIHLSVRPAHSACFVLLPRPHSLSEIASGG